MVEAKPLDNDSLYRDRFGKWHKKPSHEPVSFRLSAYGILCNKNSEIYLVVAGVDDRWEVPGGGVELGESVAAGVEREFYEETGYRTVANTEKPLGMFETNFFHPAGRYCYSVGLYIPLELKDEKRNEAVVNTVFENEIKHSAWVSLDELSQENCHHTFWPFLKTLKA